MRRSTPAKARCAPFGIARRSVPHTILPGFGLGLGITLLWLSLIVLLPLSTLAFGAAAIGGRSALYRVLEAGEPTGEVRLLTAEEAEDYDIAQPGEPLDDADLLAPTRAERFRSAVRHLGPKLWAALANPRVLASFRVTFGTALAAALLDLLLGGVVAYALVRLELPFRRLVDALVDLPFAMPTAVCGIAMAGLYAPTGITLAMIFIGLPFVVRTLQPALTDLGHELEEAAESLGATVLALAMLLASLLLIVLINRLFGRARAERRL